MAGGRILKMGDPEKLTAELDGRLWTMFASKDEAERLRDQLPVISSRIRAGRSELRVQAESYPAGFDMATPTLEDVYFTTLRDHGFSMEAD